MFDRTRASVADQHALVESLAGLAPVGLAAALDRLDRTILAGSDLAAVIAAEQRLVCWASAGMAASMAEFARCPTDRFAEVAKVRADADGDDADDELALLLHLTSTSAAYLLAHAGFAYRTAKVVWGCWRDGLIDQAKVRALEDATADCDPELANTVALIMLSAVVIDKAGCSNLERAVADTPPAFRRRALRLLLKLDPDASARRREERVTRRRMVAGQDRDGLGYLSGLDLPLEQVVAADGFVDQLARQLKHRGDERTMACLRADVFTALLTGQTAEDILGADAGDTVADEAGDPPGSRDAERPGVAYANRQTEYPSAAELVRYGYGEPVDQDAVDAAVVQLTADWQVGSGWQLAGPADSPARVEVRDRHAYPYESDCRDAAIDDAAAVVAICDWRSVASTRGRHRYYPAPWHTASGPGEHGRSESGHLEPERAEFECAEFECAESGKGESVGSTSADGATTTVPATATDGGGREPARLAPPVGGRWLGRPLVELVVPYDLLCGGSTPGEANGWGLIPADVARRLIVQAAAAPSDWCLTTVDDTGRVISHSRTTHDPTAAQKRFVRARDRMCSYPGCRRTADRCDLDHRIPWEHGGATCPCNLHPLCRHHHQVKQTDGWQVSRHPTTGTTRWSSPHGVTAHNDTDTLDPDLYQRSPDPPDNPPGDPPGQRHDRASVA